MFGFGAILKAITRQIELSADATDRVLLAAIRGRRPKLIPLTIPADSRRPRR